MPFLRAGFNPDNYDTGIRAFTVGPNGGKYRGAELRQFVSGDYFWYRNRAFIAWPHTVRFGDPIVDAMEAQENYTEIEVRGCNIETRREGVSYAPFLAPKD